MQHMQSRKERLINRILFEEGLEAERGERYTVTHEMFAHGFDPVKTEGVKHGTGTLHDTENGDGQGEPEVEGDNDHDHPHGGRLLFESAANGHVPQHDRELLVGQRQSPQTQVGGGVGDTVQTEFNSVDDLVDHDLAEVELLVLFITEILGDHGDTFTIAGHAVATTIGIVF